MAISASGWVAAIAAAALAIVGGADAEGARETAPDALQLMQLAQLGANPFASLVTRRTAASNVERYVTTEGDRAFLFEYDEPYARVKFLCAAGDPRLECTLPGGAEEIHMLTGARGPRGDLFYKTRDGVTVLRMPQHGGAIVSWPGETSTRGAEKAELQPGDTLRLAPQTSSFAARRASAAMAAVMQKVGRPISFDIGAAAARTPARPAALGALDSEAAPAESEASVLADAVVRAAAGIDLVARDAAGARAVAQRLTAVRFVEAPRAGVALDGKTLVISYDPGGGVGGRPSAAEVARFLEQAL